MRMIALQTVKAGGTHVAPGGEFDVADNEVRGLIAAGAAREKGKADEADPIVVPVAESTAPRGPAPTDPAAGVVEVAKARPGR